MKKIIPGIIVTTFALYIWGFLYWGVSTIPYSGWKQTADDELTQQMLAEHFPESGVYFVSGFNHEAEELNRLFEQGPTGFVTISLEGRSQVGPGIMIGSFVLTLLIVSLMAAMFRVAGHLLGVFMKQESAYSGSLITVNQPANQERNHDRPIHQRHSQRPQGFSHTGRT
ncbi:MAG: hypothetical protein IIB71_00790 [Proteobacteria bacterium]|nr:hypothetical protein [Pseudomonadota bacterium]